MALKPKGNLLVIAAVLAVATLIWSSGGVIFCPDPHYWH